MPVTEDVAASPITTPLCSWRDCSRAAEGEVHGQWTLFDFDAWPTCPQHSLDISQWVWRRTVDDQPPIDVWLDLWDMKSPPPE